MHDTELLKNIDITEVCDLLDIEMQPRGNGISILCPIHNDTNFGSCFLRNNRWHCFVCNEGGDAISLVMATLNLSFTEACAWLDEKFSLNTTSYAEHFVRMPPADILDLLNANPEPVWETLYMVSPDYVPQRNERVRYVGTDGIYAEADEEEQKRYPNGYYLLERKVDANPLKTLLNEDPRTAVSLLGDMAVAKTEELCANENFYTDIFKQYIPNECNEDSLEALFRQEILHKIKKCEDFARICGKTINQKRKRFFGKYHGVHA